MSTQIRPRYLFCLTLFNSVILVSYLISTRFALLHLPFPSQGEEKPAIWVASSWEQDVIRINMAQTYENARLDLLTPPPLSPEDDDPPPREDEKHEDYIIRLSQFMLSHFNGSTAQVYLKAMLVNLNDHISPPLLDGGIRKGIIRIVSDDQPVERRKAKRKVGLRGDEWDMNVFDQQGMDRAFWSLSLGSEKLEELWKTVSSPGDRKILLKYLALLLWGGAYAEDDGLLKSIDLSSIAKTAHPPFSPVMTSIRNELQLLAPVPPPLPRFMPTFVDHKWAPALEADALQEISLVLHCRPGVTWMDEYPLSSEMIMAKAFHPVFLDIVQRSEMQIGRINTDRDAGIITALDDDRVYHDCVDRYLQVQYGASLAEMVAREHDVRIGDVLLVRSHA